MQNGSAPGTVAAEASTSLLPEPHFLVELEPWPRAFFRNLLDLLRSQDGRRIEFSFLDLNSVTGSFWADVFVTTRLPWRRFAESALYHALTIAVLWSLPRLLPPPIHPMRTHTSESASVIYYSQDEYLPPLNTGAKSSARPQRGEPEYARQAIISVPPEPDNSRQTIVTPPPVKLEHDVDIPNIVAWTPPRVPVPIAATARSAADLPMPALPVSVVAPAPEVSRPTELNLPTLTPAVIAPAPQIDNAAARTMDGPKLAIIQPPPSLQATATRKLGDIDLGPTQVIAPAPQLALAAQHTAPDLLGASPENPARAVVPPPPLVAAALSSPVAPRLVALGLRPAVLRVPIDVPAGNRRGNFAATPQGKPGAPGTPEVRADVAGTANSTDSHDASTPAKSMPADLPSGLYIGPSQNPEAPTSGTADNPNHAAPRAVDPRLLASMTFPKVAATKRSAVPVDNIHASDLEKQVFGPRRFYSMTLNMPNLNSIGGSWVIRFAELKEDGARGELIPPVATQKVDPAYPAELMRTRVEGTITLYAVIRSDGTVGEVRVLRGTDDRLSRFACSALARWHFRPATKNGNAIALEAVVTIPFQAVERQ